MKPRIRTQRPTTNASGRHPAQAQRLEQPNPLNPSHWALHHFDCLTQSLWRMLRNPLSSALICAVIGIALTLPLSLYRVLDVLRTAGASWDSAVEITVFMQAEVQFSEAQKVAATLSSRTEVKSIRSLSPSDALAEYQILLDAQRVLAALGSQNPFPSVLIIKLNADQTSPDIIRRFVKDLENLGGTRAVHLDKTLIDKLYKLIEIGNRTVLVLTVVLAVGVLLIIGNTIRLDIQNKHEEIIVAKLIGATDGYIRRPFLYSGWWYGVIGAGVAWLVTSLGLLYLSGPVIDLQFFGATLPWLSVMDIKTTGILFGVSILLGLLGSALSVRRHLKSIEPS